MTTLAEFREIIKKESIRLAPQKIGVWTLYRLIEGYVYQLPEHGIYELQQAQ